MAEYADREHYIPLRKSDLIELLSKDKQVKYEEREPFRQFCKLVGAVWHFEYLDTLEKLKDSYAPFDPDTMCQPLTPVAPEDRPQRLDVLFDEVIKLMERANFKRLTRKDIEAATEGGASDWGINMNVDFDVFERLELFCRGEGRSTRIKKHPIFFWRKEEKKVDTYGRLILLVKLRKHKRLPEHIDTDDVFMKMFKDIPKLDLEMVLPGTTIQMPFTQKGKMGVSLAGSLGFALWKVGAALWTGVMKLITMATAAVSTVAVTAYEALWGPVLLLGGYGYKQFYTYKVTKQTYSKMLTESLYYQNLDNNAGVMTQLLDEAEEQECRETLLAYFFLWKYAPPQGWTSEQLDDYVELYLEEAVKLKVDFEIGDALEKLERLEIVHKDGEHYRAVALENALEKLDYRWDNYFKYNKA